MRCLPKRPGPQEVSEDGTYSSFFLPLKTEGKKGCLVVARAIFPDGLCDCPKDSRVREERGPLCSARANAAGQSCPSAE